MTLNVDADDLHADWIAEAARLAGHVPDADLFPEQSRHGGPGKHPNGTPQAIHGGPGWAHNALLEKVAEHGGGSLKLDGSEPVDGYMVADLQGGRVIPAADFFDPATGPSLVAEFVREHRAEFDSPDTFVGLWWDKPHREVDLDVSHRITDREKAIAKGQAENQQGIWDVVAGRDTGDGFVPTGGAGVGRARVRQAPEAGERDDRGGDRRLVPFPVGAGGDVDARLRAALVGFLSTRHLPGQHNQQDHAGKGAAGGMAALTAAEQAEVLANAARYGVTPESFKEAARARIEAAKSMPDPYQPGLTAYEGGIGWYEMAKGEAERVGEGDPVKGAALIAVLSSQCPWDANVRCADAMAHLGRHPEELEKYGGDPFEWWQGEHKRWGDCGPQTRDKIGGAWRIVQGESPGTVITGRKRQNFFENILDPSNGDFVTVNGHMTKVFAWVADPSTLKVPIPKDPEKTPTKLSNYLAGGGFLGRSVDRKGKTQKNGKVVTEAHVEDLGYRFVGQQILDLAQETGLRPNQIQAILWNTAVTQPWPKAANL